MPYSDGLLQLRSTSLLSRRTRDMLRSWLWISTAQIRIHGPFRPLTDNKTSVEKAVGHWDASHMYADPHGHSSFSRGTANTVKKAGARTKGKLDKHLAEA